MVHFEVPGDKQTPEIIIRDYKADTIINTYCTEDDVILHFNGSYNIENNFLALYAKCTTKDRIYIYDYNTLKRTNLVSIRPNTNLYNDIIQSIDKEILYTVQLNVSGKISDHYFGEIYDLNTMKMSQFKRAIDIVKTKKYFALLRFDEVENINKVHFELYEK